MSARICRALRKHSETRRTSLRPPPSPKHHILAKHRTQLLLHARPRPSESNPRSPAQRNTTTLQSLDRARLIASSLQQILARSVSSQLAPPPPPSPASLYPTPRSPKSQFAILERPFLRTRAPAQAPKAHPPRPVPPSLQTKPAHPQPSSPSAPPRQSNQTRLLPQDNVPSREFFPASASIRKSRKNAPARVSIHLHRSPLRPSNNPTQSPPPLLRSTPRRPFQIPRIARLPAQRIVCLIRHQKFRRIRISQNNRTRRPQPRNQRRIHLRHIILPQQRPRRCRPARHINTAFNRQRNAMQRLQRVRHS